jgi:DNA mismatch endonuclease, patch repair protein
MNRQSAGPPLSPYRQQVDDGQLSWASSPAVRRNMQANRGRDTGPELKLRRLLHAAGFRYRVDWPIPDDRRRRIDIAFPRRKIAVFVDGCFWHRCPSHYVSPKANADFWDTKIRGNTDRDAKTTAQLTAAGWLVLRFWEHENPQEMAERIGVVLQDIHGARKLTWRLDLSRRQESLLYSRISYRTHAK